jgi:hypothetical protein
MNWRFIELGFVLSKGGIFFIFKKSVLGLVEVEQLVLKPKNCCCLLNFRVDISTVAVLSRRIINQVL